MSFVLYETMWQSHTLTRQTAVSQTHVVSYNRQSLAKERSGLNALAKDQRRFYGAAVESSQLLQYLPVLMLGLFAAAFAAGTLAVSVLVGKRGKRSRAKDTPYECGMIPVGEGKVQQMIRIIKDEAGGIHEEIFDDFSFVPMLQGKNK
jgi:hypothetical protein